jgi:hypothetical protein
MQSNFRNMQEFWDWVDNYKGDELKKAAFCMLLIAELSGDVDQLQWKLAIERAKTDMRASIIPDLRS